jgi:Alginate lyase
MPRTVVARTATMALALGLMAGASHGCGGPSNLSDALTATDDGGAETGTGSGGASSDAWIGGADDGDTSFDLHPNVAPGGNFDLSLWELQEPVGMPEAPTIIKPAALQGPGGYQDSYFFTDPTDGAMTFWAPENGVTTPNSNYPRSELRELNADGSSANWPVAGTNTLSATVAVTQVPNHVCVGQIHVGTAIQAGLAASTKPLLELYYYQNGSIQLGIEDGPVGGQTLHPIVNVPSGSAFSYTIQLTGDGTITLILNGATTTFATPAIFAGYGQYFKAGNYDQTAGTDPAVGATVKFYALQVSHQP